MSIIQPGSGAITQDVAGSNAIQMTNSINNSFGLLSRNAKQLFNDVWANPVLTPQQVMDSFGTNAGQLFNIMNATITFLNTIQAGTWVTPIPYNFTINNDGTVTIGSAIGA